MQRAQLLKLMFSSMQLRYCFQWAIKLSIALFLLSCGCLCCLDTLALALVLNGYNIALRPVRNEHYFVSILQWNGLQHFHLSPGHFERYAFHSVRAASHAHALAQVARQGTKHERGPADRLLKRSLLTLVLWDVEHLCRTIVK